MEKHIKGIYNVGSDSQNYSISELAKKIQLKIPESQSVFIDQKEDKRSYRINFDKIKKEIFVSEKIIDDAIDEIKNAKDQNIIKDYSLKEYSNLKTFETISNLK